MDISSSLLVALMFIGIISVGIVSLIGGLAAVVNTRSVFKADRLHTSWVLLLLIIHFRFFWHVLDILGQNEWVFTTFLYMMLGPILLYFATGVLLPDATDENAADVRGHYFDVAPQFFLLMALVQFWLVGVDILLGSGVGANTAINVLAGLLFLFLARRVSPRVHELITAALWIVFVGGGVLRALGITGSPPQA